MVIVVVEAEEEVVVEVDQGSVDINPVYELSVVPRLLKELGHGKHRSCHPLVHPRSVEELWFIPSGSSPQLIAPFGLLPHQFVSGEVKSRKSGVIHSNNNKSSCNETFL